MVANTLSSLLISFNINNNIKTGFYELVVKSKLETAKKFSQWVYYI